MKRKAMLYVIGFLFFTVFALPGDISAAPYYEGKVLRIIVGYKPGGGYDRMARLVAKYLPRYIPGKPTVIIENMEGADSIIAANYLYNIAKPDGLTIGTFNRTLLFAPMMTLEGSKFDIAKYSWIGSTAVEGTVLTVRQDLPYRTITDLLKTKTPLVLGSTGPMDPGSQFPNLLKEFAGLNATLITYPSSADVMLAVERREVDGRAGAYSSLKPFIDRGLVRPLVRGQVAEKGMENLPVNTDFTTDKKGKAIMGVFSIADLIGRPYVAPPKTPVEIMNILMKAFTAMGDSPELQAEAEKVGMGIKYTSGKEVLKAITSTLNQPPEIISEFSKYMKYQK